MLGRHHQLNGREFEQSPGNGEGQGDLVCCSPWGCKESDDLATEQEVKELCILKAYCVLSTMPHAL